MKNLSVNVLSLVWEHPIENAIVWLISDCVCHKSHIRIQGETSFTWNKWLETAVTYRRRT